MELLAPGNLSNLHIDHLYGIFRTSRTRVLLGADATEDALQEPGPGSYRIVHIAAHSVSDAQPYFGLRFAQPALLLSREGDRTHDGILTLDEILRLQTRADLVVLSGCATGVGWRSLGEGAYGLAGAFLHAGSRSVAASGWPISDRHTAALMKTMYDELAEGASAASALRDAQRRTLRDHPEPFYWAGFRGHRSRLRAVSPGRRGSSCGAVNTRLTPHPQVSL